ncbi:MAG: sialate O-acetylesterase [Prevotella nigrescens]|nr:sialate O-acetylesterase [uncultured Prevotella sp.]
MKKTVISLVLFLMGISVNAQDQNYWIYLVIGQDNMIGKADAGTSTNGFLLDSFSKTIAETAKGKRIGFVTVTLPVSPIIAFDKQNYRNYVSNVTVESNKKALEKYDNNPYGKLVSMARSAQNKGVVKGILLQQDGIDNYNEAWLKRMRRIYYDIVGDLSLDSTKVPLLIGEVGRAEYGGKYAAANETYGKMHKVLQYSFVVSSANCPLADNKIYYSKAGLENLGRKFAIKALQGIGYEFPEVRRTTSITKQTIDRKTLEIKVHISDKGMLAATSNEPIVKISVLNAAGDNIKDIAISEPTKEYDLDLNAFPQGKITVTFYTTDGEQSFKIND